MKKCGHKGCSKNARLTRNGYYNKYCSFHHRRITISRFLSNLYSKMKQRVTTGSNTNCPHLYVGKPIMQKDVFLMWSKNNPDFLSLYKRWAMSDFDRKLTPVVNRLKSSKGYTLDNVEWITNSQNSVLAASVRKMKAKKEVYDLLGVNIDV